MFQQIEIKNFKSLADTKTDLGQFTVLVGHNGSGKSSFLQAIELASWAVRFPSINDALQLNNIEFRDLVYLRAARVAIEFNAELSIPQIDRVPERVRVELELAKRRYVYVANELVLPVEPEIENLRYGVQSTQRKRVAFEKPGEPISHDNVSLGHSVLLDVHRSRSAGERFPILSEVARHFVDYVHYEIWGPENLRNPTRPRKGRSLIPSFGTDRLAKDGGDLPGLLHRIRQDESKWIDLRNDLQEAYPRIEEIHFKRGLERGELGLLFVERSPASSRPLVYRPSQMSDGFLRILALLAIKHQPKPLALLGYEEPENGLHPTALDDCMRHLKAIARNGTQVIVTTHSPYLLNHILEDEAEPRAELRLVFRDQKTGKTTIAPPDPEKVERARRQGFGIGELWGMLLDEKELAQK